MDDMSLWFLAAAVAVNAALTLTLLLRRPRFETPADLEARLRVLAGDVAALQQGLGRAEGRVAALADTVQGLETELRAGGESLRMAVEAKLLQSVEEGRSGRREMAEAFATFETRLSGTLATRLEEIRADSARKLDEMRQTVDERLQATLEQRLGESFRLVSERLEQVHSGLGEMRSLAGSVGDLKRVMGNVRARGTWGELQLGAIVETLLTPDQYARNVKPVPGSDGIVEFAIRMPGRTDGEPVWLPIDSKYPVEDYQRLLDAHETLDRSQIQRAEAAFEASLRAEARKIAGKYLSPPHTTDFAILFVPTEGLFAEALRIPGFAESLQNEHRAVLAGPTTLAATLNSLRLGFRTLAIERRSSEVWTLLGTVKTEFRKFGEVVDATKRSIDSAADRFAELGRRTRAIERGLRAVEAQPEGIPGAPGIAGDEADDVPRRA
jgi:DNA recombination protein RmuC